MKEQPLVSVVTIFLNAEGFISEAIESVLHQTYSFWELLLIDDGSTDTSTQIAKNYATKFPGRIRYLEHEGHQNKGMSASRNLGIDSAKGEWIAILDSDDVWLPPKLETRMKLLERFDDVGLLFGKSLYWRSWNGEKDSVPKFRIAENTKYEPPSLVHELYPLGNGGAPCPSSFIFRKSVVIASGKFEEEFTGIYSLYEDQAFLIKMYLHHPVYFADETLEKYRIHDDSCVATVTASGQYTEVRSYFLNWLKNYFDRNNINKPEIREALEQAFFQTSHPMLHKMMRVTRSIFR